MNIQTNERIIKEGTIEYIFFYKPEQVVICPVCKGKGILPNGFYNHLGFTEDDSYSTVQLDEFEKCRSCYGRGIIIT